MRRWSTTTGRYLLRVVNALATAGFLVAVLLTRNVVVALLAVLGVVAFILTAPRLWDRRVKDISAHHWGAYQSSAPSSSTGCRGMTTLKVFNATAGHRRSMLATGGGCTRTCMRHLGVSLVDGTLTALGQGAGAGAGRVARHRVTVPHPGARGRGAAPGCQSV